MNPKDLNDTQRPVWDLFVRIFHWTLVGCVLLNYVVLEEGETPHQWVGYLASTLVMARIVWGFIGSRHARFSDFFPTPSRLKHHVRAMLTRQPDHHWGHNPLGAMMMLLLMSLVLSLGVTGWMQGTDAYFGEEWLQELHELLANTLVLSAGLHALAALVMGRIERTRLVKAMVTGVKER
ncbi:MAG TPA: cytochrome b/b6 domain-containing protein, partial [Burkholderiaceae bacterium]|nr:cytochrome b/b6 domain-containing protein [Burkholderiaceae bacterium]